MGGVDKMVRKKDVKRVGKEVKRRVGKRFKKRGKRGLRGRLGGRPKGVNSSLGIQTKLITHVHKNFHNHVFQKM